VKYRVIQWATGGVGRAALEGILDHSELELVGCWVHDPAKAGRDAGALIGRPATGVVATNDVAAILRTPADCVLYSPRIANPKQVAALLEAGKNVVTPLGWFYPFHAANGAALELACRRGGTTLHGTGIHPGGITERFPLVFSALSRAITHVRAEEWSDIRSYGAPAVISDVMGFGKTPEEAKVSPMARLLGAGFLQSVDLLADALGFALDAEKRTTHELALATAPIDSPIGTIAPGRVAAQRFSWQGTVRGEPVITARVNWLMGDAELDPPWRFGPEGERFEVEVTGDPPVQATFHGLHPESIAAGLARNPGIVATALHCVSAIPAVCRAEPGIKTYLELPPYGGRAAPHLTGRRA
jgi:hypothetical protein